MTLKGILDRWKIEAVIFDIDGTMINNNKYHLLAWKEYLKSINREISAEEYNAYVNGRTNKDVIEYIYERQMSDEESMRYALEKEAIYRKIYLPFIEPVPGLTEVLDSLKKSGIPMAIATSGIKVNIDFMFEHLGVRDYFNGVIDSSHISKGKPDPEIYVKAAALLNTSPGNCLVFEDAVVGVASARSAGMKVIALTTTHPADELREADIVIEDFTVL